MTKSNGDYKIGKGKPPAHSRFKKGQSGNPGGRKKGTTNPKASFEQALQQTVPYRENGELKTMTMCDAVFRQLNTQVLKGNLKAIAMVIRLAESWLDEDPEAAIETPEEDLEILQRAFSDPQLRRQMTGEQKRQRDPEPSEPEESGDD